MGSEMSASPEDRLDSEIRAVMNQLLFREINERVKELNEGFSMVLPVGEWICECANDTCVERVEMSPQEYEAIRRDGARFFVAPSDEHIWADSQRITERHSRYWVVEKTGEPRGVAKRADPLPTTTVPCPSTRRGPCRHSGLMPGINGIKASRHQLGAAIWPRPAACRTSRILRQAGHRVRKASRRTRRPYCWRWVDT